MAVPAPAGGGMGGMGGQGGEPGLPPGCVACVISNLGPLVGVPLEGDGWSAEAEPGERLCLPVERPEACVFVRLEDLGVWHPDGENPEGCEVPSGEHLTSGQVEAT